MRGNITRRGKQSWRLKFDVGADEHGKRLIRYVTLKGKRSDAEAELARLLNDAHRGTLVDLSKVRVGDYLHSWLDSKTNITNVTRERYSRLSRIGSSQFSARLTYRSSSQSMFMIGCPIL